MNIEELKERLLQKQSQKKNEVWDGASAFIFKDTEVKSLIEEIDMGGKKSDDMRDFRNDILTLIAKIKSDATKSHQFDIYDIVLGQLEEGVKLLFKARDLLRE